MTSMPSIPAGGIALASHSNCSVGLSFQLRSARSWAPAAPVDRDDVRVGGVARAQTARRRLPASHVDPESRLDRLAGGLRA